MCVCAVHAYIASDGLEMYVLYKGREYTTDIPPFSALSSTVQESARIRMQCQYACIHTYCIHRSQMAFLVDRILPGCMLYPCVVLMP